MRAKTVKRLKRGVRQILDLANKSQNLSTKTIYNLPDNYIKYNRPVEGWHPRFGRNVAEGQTVYVTMDCFRFYYKKAKTEYNDAVRINTKVKSCF